MSDLSISVTIRLDSDSLLALSQIRNAISRVADALQKAPPGSENSPVKTVMDAPLRAVTLAPAPAVASSGDNGAAGALPNWVTAQRVATLRQMFPTVFHPNFVMHQLRLDSGPPLPAWGIVMHYAEATLGLKRATKVPIVRAGDGPIPIDLEGLRVRGKQWNIRVESAADLFHVNAHAKRVGHPGFDLQST